MKNKAKIHFIYVAIILVFFGRQQSYGQENFKGFSINPKAGFYNLSEQSSGFTIGIEAGLIQDRFIYSADIIGGKEFLFLGDPSPAEYFGEASILMGRFTGNKYFRFLYQGGLSVFAGVKRTVLIEEGHELFGVDHYDTRNFVTIGLPLKVGFRFTPCKYLGIGVDLHTNFNFEKTVFMPMISLEIGRLR